jgi:hypothetical protein
LEGCVDRIVDHNGRPDDRLSSNEVHDIVSDSRWFPLEFDINNEEFRFVFIPPETLRETAFVRSIKTDDLASRFIPYSDICDAGVQSSKLHLILHSSQGGSTLLTRALGQPGVVTPLQEPPILTDVIAYGLRKSPNQTRALLAKVTRLLSRPFPGDSVAVCKLSHIGTGLSIPMAEAHSNSKILCLDTPLEEMLSSYAAHGAEGRRAARKLLIGIKNSRMLAVALPEEKYPEFIDLQFAALSWLSMRKMMLEAATTFGEERVRTITTGQFIQSPRETLLAVAKFLDVQLDVDQRLASGIFDRHSKTGEPFNPGERAERTAERLRTHREEIEPVVEWTRRVAESTGVDWDLPYPLLSKNA